MKQAWVNRSTWSCTPSTTRGAALPTLVTAIPDPRSISELPSTSISTPPPASTMNAGSITLTPRATANSRRANSSGTRARHLGGETPFLHDTADDLLVGNRHVQQRRTRQTGRAWVACEA